MKKILYCTIVIGGLFALTSCGTDQCECDNGVTITEGDAEDSGVSLSEACDLAKVADETCAIQ